jgi:hypothetical protein
MNLSLICTNEHTCCIRHQIFVLESNLHDRSVIVQPEDVELMDLFHLYYCGGTGSLIVISITHWCSSSLSFFHHYVLGFARVVYKHENTPKRGCSLFFRSRNISLFVSSCRLSWSAALAIRLRWMVLTMDVSLKVVDRSFFFDFDDGMYRIMIQDRTRRPWSPCPNDMWLAVRRKPVYRIKKPC